MKMDEEELGDKLIPLSPKLQGPIVSTIANLQSESRLLVILIKVFFTSKCVGHGWVGVF